MSHNELSSESQTSDGVIAVRQLTIRGFDPELEQAIKNLAEREGISLNKAVLRLLRRGAGLRDGRVRQACIGNSLDHLVGSWSEEDARAMADAERDFERIDPNLWE